MPRLFVALLLTTFISTSSEALVCRNDNDNVTGRVVSPTAIVVGDFMCRFTYFTSHVTGGGLTYMARDGRGVLIHVAFKNPEDVNTMQPGNLVKLKGHFTAESLNGRNRLAVSDAEPVR
jgi:hypothetical protein